MINNENCKQKWKLYKGLGGGDSAGVVLKSTHFVDAIVSCGVDSLLCSLVPSVLSEQFY